MIETYDILGTTGLRLLQSGDGYRFSLDPVLLCGFANLGSGTAVADLGTGNGVIPLLLSSRNHDLKITGFEIQASMVCRARRNVELNGLCDLIEIVQADVCQIDRLVSSQSFDMVFSNPPFRVPGAGRIADGVERSSARHELVGGVDDFFRAARFMLKNKGRFFLVHLPERMAEILALLQELNIEPKRLRMVHSKMGKNACLFLLEARRAGKPGLKVEHPLYIYDGEGYSAEVTRIYDAFG